MAESQLGLAEEPLDAQSFEREPGRRSPGALAHRGRRSWSGWRNVRRLRWNGRFRGLEHWRFRRFGLGWSKRDRGNESGWRGWFRGRRGFAWRKSERRHGRRVVGW